MPNENGIWNQEEANQHHAFDYYLAKWIGTILPKNQTIIDAGCGLGSYLKYLWDIGFRKLKGIEGERLVNSELPERVMIGDLATDLQLQFHANVICLEVGEHIPEPHLGNFIENISRPVAPGHKLILSWAVPGQEGIGHVSCRTNEWVIDQMAGQGLKLDESATKAARENVSNHCAYFRETLMVFKR